MGPEKPPAGFGAPTRRRLLATAGAVATAAGLAGCGTVSDYEFAADPVVLPAEERESLDYVETLREPIVDRRSGEVGGVDVEVTVESRLAVYEPAVAGDRSADGSAGASRDGAGGPAATVPNVGALSTPRASVMGRSFNPLARLSLGDLLADEAGSGVLARVGLGAVGHDRSTVAWARGPVLLDERAGSCLGESTTLRGYAGLLAGDPPTAAYVHLLRVDPDDVLLAAAVHGRDVDARDAPFVGRDGYIPVDDYEVAADRFDRACAELGYE